MALSADQAITRSEGDIAAAHVKASTTCYGGGLVNRLTSTGLIQPATDAGSVTFAGVLREQVTGNAGGTTTCEVWQTGVFEMTYYNGSATDALAGTIVTVYDDSQVSISGTTTNDLACGKIVGVVPSSSGIVYVRIDGYAV